VCTLTTWIILHSCVASVGFSNLLLSLGPVGYWRLGEWSGTVAVDLSTNHINGTYYNSPALQQLGAIRGDRNFAVSFDERHRAYVEVPDHEIYSLTRAWDNFNRLSSFGSNWGTSSGGGDWAPQVSSGNYYATGLVANEHVAIIRPKGKSGTWQQGLPQRLLSGDTQVRAAWTQHATGGPLQPVSLVARRVDEQNFVRAELRENANHTLDLSLIKTVNGTSTTLATAMNIGIYNLGDWWYIRFQFVGTQLRAKAWIMDMHHHSDPGPKGNDCHSACPISYEPTSWQVTATDVSVHDGNVAIRSANSRSHVRPNVFFEGFWAQTPGFTIHMWWKATARNFVGEGGPQARFAQVFGKGPPFGSDGGQEYESRFFSADSRDTPGVWKMYIFNKQGGLGAGVRYPPSKSDGPIPVQQWMEFVVEFDSGDYLDTNAGVSLYANGQLVSSPSRCNGNLYAGLCAYNQDGSYNAQYILNPEWQITPVSGTAPLRFATQHFSSYFTGELDEVAIFGRKLTPDEIMNLFNAAVQL
jgi:hypothetical protein